MTNQTPIINHIPLADLIPAPENNRKKLKPEDPKIKELAESVRTLGQLQPGLARPHPKKKGTYDLRCGARRHMACAVAGLDTMLVVVKDMSDQEALEATVTENLQREDLSPFEEAKGVQMLRDSGWDLKTVAEHLGKSERWVLRRAQLMNLTPEWIEVINNPDEYDLQGWSHSHFTVIAILPPETQKEALEDITWRFDVNPKVKEIQEYINRNYMHQMKMAAWDLNDPDIIKDAGSCAECNKRHSCNPELFDDPITETDLKKDRCMDPVCWDTKNKAGLYIREKKLIESHGSIHYIDPDAWRVDDEYVNFPDREIWGKSQYESCKKNDKGALPAMDIRNGHLVWIKKKKEAKSASKSGNGKPKTMKVRRELLDRKRWFQVIHNLRDLFDDTSQFTPEYFKMDNPGKGTPVVLMVIALASEIGTDEHNYYPSDKPWKKLKELLKQENTDIAMHEPLEKLWFQVMAVLNERLTYNGPITQTSDNLIQEAKQVAQLFGINIQKLYKSVAKSKGFTEPKSWANLNENGTPKKKKK